MVAIFMSLPTNFSVLSAPEVCIREASIVRQVSAPPFRPPDKRAGAPDAEADALVQSFAAQHEIALKWITENLTPVNARISLPSVTGPTLEEHPQFPQKKSSEFKALHEIRFPESPDEYRTFIVLRPGDVVSPEVVTIVTNCKIHAVSRGIKSTKWRTGTLVIPGGEVEVQLAGTSVTIDSFSNRQQDASIVLKIIPFLRMSGLQMATALFPRRDGSGALDFGQGHIFIRKSESFEFTQYIRQDRLAAELREFSIGAVNNRK
jgi:hypothetical protein